MSGSIIDEIIVEVGWAIDLKYFYVSCLTFLVYDAVLCLPNEMKFIWSFPKSPITWLYWVNRYIALLSGVLLVILVFLPTNDILCKGLTPLIEVLSALIHLIVNCIFVVRLMALYTSDKKMRAIIMGIFISTAIVALVLGLHSLHLNSSEVIDAFPGVYACSREHLIRSEYNTAWILIMVIDVLYSVLAVRKAALIWKETTGLTGARLAFMLIRDQAIYFFIVIWVALLTVIYYSIYTSVGVALAMTILDNPLVLSPFAARCVLNMKKAGSRGGNAGTNYVLSPLSTARFESKRVAQTSDTQDSAYTSFGHSTAEDRSVP